MLAGLLLLTPSTVAEARAAPSAAPSSGNAECIAAARSGDPQAARRTCLPGRERGNAVDAYNLALALYRTEPGAAMEHLRWAADAGLAEAAHVLGNLRLDAGDTRAGLARLEAAARAGLALAQYDYATALLERNDDGDRAAAVRWYGRAAAGGEAAARYNLGVLLLSGRIGERSPLEAWAWLSSLDAMDGHAEMFRLAGELASQMSAAEKTRAREHLEAVRADPVAAAGRLAERLGPDAATGG
ncbi:MAG: hypothetical protein U5R48_05545 [Gammaproteobacteria bacterium]|nr:hypothetical protein [Gammaproteobacteria bacterium]